MKSRRMLYFAYGSNLCAGWLAARTPSARVAGIARLDGHAFRFHKYSACDRSGKADAFRTGGADAVWGALFEMSAADRKRLGRIEGGYDDRGVEVVDASGARVAAFTFIARPRSINARYRPFDWYRRLIVEGGRARGLPEDYVAAIEAHPSTKDPNRRRVLKAERALTRP